MQPSRKSVNWVVGMNIFKQKSAADACSSHNSLPSFHTQECSVVTFVLKLPLPTLVRNAPQSNLNTPRQWLIADNTYKPLFTVQVSLQFANMHSPSLLLGLLTSAAQHAFALDRRLTAGVVGKLYRWQRYEPVADSKSDQQCAQP